MTGGRNHRTTSISETTDQSTPQKNLPGPLSLVSCIAMCFYDLIVWNCDYWRWGKFRERCHKEERAGETCGMKLIFERRNQQTNCSLYNQITKKNNTIKRTVERMARLREWNYYASVTRCEEDLAELKVQIQRLDEQHLRDVCGEAYFASQVRKYF
jgi:hypothetical protein